MLIQSAERKVELEGLDSNIKKFSIKNSSMAFKILSDKLYSDKPLAVIRELSCNAYDAHIAAGNKDVPFEVHLPNSFEPYFFIRDFGTGLSDERIENLYTTYFESTKSDSNEFIGALGLGSKSPFSYVDQFTVESFYNGVKSIYNAFIAEDGTPSITKIYSEETTEPNGLKVQLMVEATDFTIFQKRAQTIFFRFPLTPIVKGAKFDIEKVEYILQGKDFKIRKSTNRDDHYGAYAIQGTVAYPIRNQYIGNNLDKKQRILLNDTPIDIEFSIGELDIAPSREELSYDKRTQQNIINKLNDIISQTPDLVKDTLATAQTEWEARRLWHSWIRSSDYISDFVRNINGNKLIWNGIEIIDSHISINLFDKGEIDEKEYNRLSDYSMSMYLTQNKIKRWGSCDFFYAHTLSKTHRQTIRTDLSGQVRFKLDAATDKVQIVFADKDDKNLRFYKRILEHNFAGQKTDVYLITLEDRAYLPLIIEQFKGCPNYTEFSSLQLPPPKPKEVRLPAVVKVYAPVAKLNKFRNQSYYPYETQPETNRNLDDGGYYFVTYSTELTHPGEEGKKVDTKLGTGAPNCGGDVNSFLGVAWNLGLFEDIKDNIYIVRTSDFDLIKDRPNWISGYNHLREKIVAMQGDAEKQQLLSCLDINFRLANQRHSFDENSIVDGTGCLYENILEMFPFKETLTILKPNSVFLKTLDLIEKINTVILEHFRKVYRDKEFTCYGRVARHNTEYRIIDSENFIKLSKHYLGVGKYNSTVAKKTCDKIIKDLLTTYPFLPHMLNQFRPVKEPYCEDNSKSQGARLSHYINLCDAAPRVIQQSYQPLKTLTTNKGESDVNS